MYMRGIIISLAMAGAVFLGSSSVATARGSELDDARQFIEGLADNAVSALTVTEISNEERVKRFRTIIDRNFAIPTIGRWVLGKYWRAASEDERREFLELFERLMISTYVDRFANYSGEKLSVIRAAQIDESDILVSSQIVGPGGGEPLSVDWRVRKRDNAFKIVDVIVAGVSMGQTQRSEFGSVIRSNGGNVSVLLSELRKRVGSGI